MKLPPGAVIYEGGRHVSPGSIPAADAVIPGAGADPVAAFRGRRARDRGEAFEAALDATHREYRREGIATLERFPVPTDPLPMAAIAPEFRARFAGRARQLARRSGYDFAGSLGPLAGSPDHPRGPARFMGRALAMEAKSKAAGGSLPIGREGEKNKGLAEHQLRALAEAWRDFGVVAVVVWWADDFRGVLLPPATLEAWRRFEAATAPGAAPGAAPTRGALSIPRGAFTPYNLIGGRFEDWLGPVRQWLEGMDAAR